MKNACTICVLNIFYFLMFALIFFCRTLFKISYISVKYIFCEENLFIHWKSFAELKWYGLQVTEILEALEVVQIHAPPWAIYETLMKTASRMTECYERDILPLSVKVSCSRIRNTQNQTNGQILACRWTIKFCYDSGSNTMFTMIL